MQKGETEQDEVPSGRTTRLTRLTRDASRSLRRGAVALFRRKKPPVIVEPGGAAVSSTQNRWSARVRWRSGANKVVWGEAGTFKIPQSNKSGKPLTGPVASVALVLHRGLAEAVDGKPGAVQAIDPDLFRRLRAAYKVEEASFRASVCLQAGRASSNMTFIGDVRSLVPCQPCIAMPTTVLGLSSAGRRGGQIWCFFFPLARPVLHFQIVQAIGAAPVADNPSRLFGAHREMSGLDAASLCRPV